MCGASSHCHPENQPAIKPHFGQADFASKTWCGRKDSNLHEFPRYHLKVVRLPIPPRPHAQVFGSGWALTGALWKCNPLAKAATCPIRTKPPFVRPEATLQGNRAILFRISTKGIKCLTPRGVSAIFLYVPRLHPVATERNLAQQQF
jgi:hypothetical protein